MLLPSLVIVCDRGGLRAYKVTPNPDRAPGLHLIDTFEASEVHGRFADKVSDQAGRFRSGGEGGSHAAGGADEHGTITLENDRRACQHVAERMNELVMREKPEAWLLAVPPQIKQMVLDRLSPAALKHLEEVAPADLLKAEPANIAKHFPVLQPA